MRRSLVLCLVLLVGVAVGRDGEHFIDELSELRAGFDGGSTTGASPAEFAQAVRKAARQAQEPQPTGNRFYAPPPLYAPPSGDRFEGDVAPPRTRDWAPVSPPQPYLESQPSDPRRPVIRPTLPQPPERPKHVLLRESAFELERIAHELEMVNLFAEADEVRSAAGKLRTAARGDDAKKAAGAASSSPPLGRFFDRIRPRDTSEFADRPGAEPGPAPVAQPRRSDKTED